MRRFGTRRSGKTRWFLPALMAMTATLAALPSATPLQAMPFHGTASPTGAVEVGVAFLFVLFAMQGPRRAIRRLGAMRRERALFRSMAAHSRQASMVCEPVRAPGGTISDFRILYTNGRGSKLLGPEVAEGKSLIGLLRRNDFTTTMTTWTRVLRTGQPEVARLPACNQSRHDSSSGHRDGCAVHVVPQSGCLVITTLQSREEQAAQRQVEELNDFTRAVFESAPVSIIATDTHGMIVAMNECAERLTGFRKHELVRQHSLLCLHDPEEMSERTASLRRATGRQSSGIEMLIEYGNRHEHDDWCYTRRDGSRVSVHLTLTPLHTDGGLSGYLAVAFDVTERKQLADTAFYMAHHDQLTGLPNRTLVRSTIEHALEEAKAASGTVAIFAVDIDHFKRINDSLGHAGGDTVLTTVAARLRASIRASDFAARLGGDEFVIICPDMRNAANAERCAQGLLEAIGRPFLVEQREVCVTASVGYCLCPEPADCLGASGRAADPNAAGSADDLLRQADLAMYAAKTSGRGRFAPFSDELQRSTRGRMEMEEDLRHALERGEFELHYQPQVACVSGNVESMEMLLRWNGPKRGNVPPDVFLPVAEEAGLMLDIAAWSLLQACTDCVAAQIAFRRRIRMAVNLSCQQIQEPKIVAIVQQALSSSGLPPEDLELEITEQVFMCATPSVLQTMDRLRALGISLAIDDFGTGFSSFAYILQYRVDRLKIDRSFVSGVVDDSHAASIVRTVVAMAHNLGLKVCAEGAETEAQVDFLTRRRCDEIQGFFFARPVPFAELAKTVLAIEQPARKHNRASLAARRHVTIPFPPVTVPAPPAGGDGARPRLQA